ncbi:fluoride efflux transporter CrcB [Staphylococcus arlettae]
MQYLYIFIGGAFGAALRYGLSLFNNNSTAFPIGTLLANLTGATLMGLLGVLSLNYFRNNLHLKKAVTTGFLGALTTFSTFQFELVTMLNHQAIVHLFIYAIISYVLGILCCYLGVKIGSWLNA